MISPPETAPESSTQSSTQKTQRAILPPNFKILPPLSPLTYYRRNIWRTLPVGGAIAISVFLVAAIVTLLSSVDASITVNYGFVKKFSVLASNLENDVNPEVRSRVLALREGPDPLIQNVVTATPYLVPLKTIFGEMPAPVYGVDEKGMKHIVTATGNHLAQGRFPRRNAGEVVMSRAWANSLGVKNGQTFMPGNERFPSLPEAQKLVGILEGGENVALADRTYLLLELPEPVQRTSYLLIAPEGKIAAMNARVDSILKQPKKWKLLGEDVRFARLYTFDDLVRQLRKSLAFLYKFLAIADALVIVAVALMAGFLANIYFEQRLGEFGLLSAFGFRRERLAKRLIVETGALVVAGWLVGVGLTWLVFQVLDATYMQPRGLVLAHLNELALRYTLPTPIIVGVASLATVLLRLYRTDPIEIMERR